MNRLRFLQLASALGCWLAASIGAAAPPTVQPGSWTLAILPDTQYYTAYNNGVFEAQTKYLADNKATLNLKFVLHEGDLTQSNTAAHWTIASNAMATLEQAGVPFSMAPGNHDLNGNVLTRDSLMSTYFPTTRLDNQASFGGVYQAEPGIVNNSYSLFSAGSVDWLVIALEYGPRDAVLDWADGLMKQYPNRKAMIVTHSYLYSDGNRMDWGEYGASQEGNPHDNDGNGVPDDQGFAAPPGDVNDGQEMWNALKDNPNLLFVFNGHSTTAGSEKWDDPGAAAYLTSTADDGHVVHQLIANYQWTAKDNGYLRLLEFQPNGQVRVRTYSPNKDAYLSDAKNEFTLTIPVATPLPGDATGDNVVNDDDARVLAKNWLAHDAAWHMGDFNSDGVVDDLDAAILAAHYQRTPAEAAVPEPSSGVGLAAILVMGAMARARQCPCGRHGAIVETRE